MTKSDGTVALHGVTTSLDSVEGRRFVADACRAAEGLIGDKELAEIYEISPADWRDITKNTALINAIRDERTRRVRNGTAAKELAAREFVKAPQVLGNILNDPSANAKHRIDSAKELRATAHGGGDGERTADTSEKFIITINLGDTTEHYEKEIKPMKPLVPVIEDKTDGDE
jgi:hypothetical protein